MATVHIDLITSPKHPFRTRLYAASSPAAQIMDRRMQKILLGHTWDFDIVNCMPTLLYQMLERLEILPVEVWKDDLELLKTVAHDRAAFAETELGMRYFSCVLAKQLATLCERLWVL